MFLWMSIIFQFSSQVAEHSKQVSKGVTEVVVETVQRMAPNVGLEPEHLHHIVRKNAHFFLYFFLGVLVIHALKMIGVAWRRGWILALLICILYAISDEVHQMFVPGRGPQVRDVLIDGAGSLTGIGLYLLFGKLVRIRKG